MEALAALMAALTITGRVVTVLEGPGGELLQTLNTWMTGWLNGEPVTPEQEQYLFEQAKASVERAHLSLTDQSPEA